MIIIGIIAVAIICLFLYWRSIHVHKVILFSSSDCPVCQDLKRDVWPKLIAAFPSVEFQDIDCTVAKEVALNYGIHAYPTVMLVRNDVSVYSGAWTVDAISAAIKA